MIYRADKLILQTHKRTDRQTQTDEKLIKATIITLRLFAEVNKSSSLRPNYLEGLYIYKGPYIYILYIKILAPTFDQ